MSLAIHKPFDHQLLYLMDDIGCACVKIGKRREFFYLFYCSITNDHAFFYVYSWSRTVHSTLFTRDGCRIVGAKPANQRRNVWLYYISRLVHTRFRLHGSQNEWKILTQAVHLVHFVPSHRTQVIVQFSTAQLNTGKLDHVTSSYTSTFI